MPAFAELARRMEVRVDVLAVTVGPSDPQAKVRARARPHALPRPVAIDDGRLARAFGLRVTARHLPVGRNGRVARVGQSHGPELEQTLARLLDGPADADAAPPGLEPAAPLQPVAAVGSPTIGEARAVDPGGSGARRGLLLLAPGCESYPAETRPAVANACTAAREGIDPRPPGVESSSRTPSGPDRRGLRPLRRPGAAGRRRHRRRGSPRPAREWSGAGPGRRLRRPGRPAALGSRAGASNRPLPRPAILLRPRAHALDLPAAPDVVPTAG